MKKLLLACLLLNLAAVAEALPGMPIVDAKESLILRKDTPAAQEFLKRRLSDLPTFDKLGFGNYHAQYALDSGRTLMIWMYVLKTPPTVDEVRLHVTSAGPKDLNQQRALQLLKLVYSDSLKGNTVLPDFQKAMQRFNAGLKATGQMQELRKAYFGKKTTAAQQQKLFQAYQTAAKAITHYIPVGFDDSLYYLGDAYGYHIKLARGGLELTIFLQAPFKFKIEQLKRRLPVLPSIPEPVAPFPPPPKPTPRPKVDW